MKRATLALAALCLLVAGAFAQDYYHGFDVYKDVPVPGPNPCYPSSKPISASPVVYDNGLNALYLCEDGRTIVRRWFRPNDNAKPPAQPTGSTCPGLAPADGFVCKNGGWVPGNHPLAR